MVIKMERQNKTEYAVKLLTEKYALLLRLPARSDFTSEEVCFIKQKLGPWPRALESAGLKEPPKISAKEKSRIKRERSRKNRKLKKLSDIPSNPAETIEAPLKDMEEQK